MRVISLIKRAQGHAVRLDGVEYAFLPPNYACVVTEPRHLERFRAVPEGYRLEAEPEALTLKLSGPVTAETKPQPDTSTLVMEQSPVTATVAPTANLKPTRRARTRKTTDEGLN